MRKIDVKKVGAIIDKYGLHNKNRNREILWMRYSVIFFLKQNGWTVMRIGGMFNQDHTTIVCGLRKINQMLDNQNQWIDFISIKESIDLELQDCYDLTWETTPL
jgi:chromosomal replication initiation ATPase DnaA